MGSLGHSTGGRGCPEHYNYIDYNIEPWIINEHRKEKLYIEEKDKLKNLFYNLTFSVDM